MLMKDDKKKAAMVIISKMRPSGEEKMQPKMEKDGAEQEYDQYEAASEEIIQAVESKDSRLLKEALKSFIDMCLSEPRDEQEEAE